MLGLSFGDGLNVNQLLEPLGQSGQLALHLGSWRRGRGTVSLPIVGEHQGINGVGLGPLAFGLSGGAHLCGINDGDGEFGLLQALDQGLFISPGCFADDVGARNSLEFFAQFRSTSGCIIQFDLSATQMHLEGGLSDINSDIDGINIYIHIIDVF